MISAMVECRRAAPQTFRAGSGIFELLNRFGLQNLVQQSRRGCGQLAHADTHRLINCRHQRRWRRHIRHFAHTGNVDAAFIAQSLLTADDASAGSSWLVPTSLHEPIEQQAVLLKRAADNVAAQQFFDFLASDAARRIILASGYTDN